MNKRLTAVSAALAIGAVLAAAGCGSSSDSTSGSGGGLYGSGGSSTPTDKSTGAAPSGDGVVTVADNAELGKIIVDAKGLTLYDFHKDKGSKSSCYGACAKVWPPLLSSGSPKAENGAEASKLATTKRTDGTTQVTYAGHPVYTYVSDQKPGDTAGNDFKSFGGEWYALTPSGAEPKG